MKKVAISGGTGLVGQALTKALRDRGDEVVLLSRSAKSSTNGVVHSQWDPSKGKLNEELLSTCDSLVNLAGAPIAQRWTSRNKQVILDSRVDSTKLLVDFLLKEEHKIETFVSGSAIGFYPDGENLWQEDDQAGSHFMSQVVQAWEEAANPAFPNIKGGIVRIGVVLSSEGGALERMLPVFKMGIGSALGSGKQWMSWIHIDDLVGILLEMIDGKLSGTFNAVAPTPERNAQFSEHLAKSLGKGFWAPKVPSFILRMAFGDMADVVLLSQKVSSKKIENNGYKFQFEQLGSALEDLF